MWPPRAISLPLNPFALLCVRQIPARPYTFQRPLLLATWIALCRVFPDMSCELSGVTEKRTSRFHFGLIALVIALSPLPAGAQTPDPQSPGLAPDPERPPLNPFPAEQNWSFLADPTKRTDFFDPVKYISLRGKPQWYLSFGLEYRIEYEYFDNWMFGAGPQDHNGYVMDRVMPHFDFHAGSNFRLFSEFEFDFEDGRNGGPRPQIDEDRGDVHQAFLEIGPHVSSPRGMSLRVGRQEVVLGTGRLFDNNEGPNVKLSFDGFRVIAEGAPHEVGFIRAEAGREQSRFL